MPFGLEFMQLGIISESPQRPFHLKHTPHLVNPLEKVPLPPEIVTDSYQSTAQLHNTIVDTEPLHHTQSQYLPSVHVSQLMCTCILLLVENNLLVGAYQEEVTITIHIRMKDMILLDDGMIGYAVFWASDRFKLVPSISSSKHIAQTLTNVLTSMSQLTFLHQQAHLPDLQHLRTHNHHLHKIVILVFSFECILFQQHLHIQRLLFGFQGQVEGFVLSQAVETELQTHTHHHPVTYYPDLC